MRESLAFLSLRLYQCINRDIHGDISLCYFFILIFFEEIYI